MQDVKILKLTLAAMFAALSFICFSYLRIEIPMGMGLPGKIYVGSAFVMLSAFILGPRYGALTGAVGLTLGDILVGYVTSAPPTFVAKFILGAVAGIVAHPMLHLPKAGSKKQRVFTCVAAGLACSMVNVLTEPVIRWAFKVYVLGLPEPVAYASAINCAISMAINSLPSIAVATVLYGAAQSTVLKDRKLYE